MNFLILQDGYGYTSREISQKHYQILSFLLDFQQIHHYLVIQSYKNWYSSVKD